MFNILNIKVAMQPIEIGQKIRQARQAKGLTQAGLALLAGVSRTTLVQLERGLITDLGIRKVQAILDQVGLTLSVAPAIRREVDFVKMAATMAGVSFREPLTEEELLHALLTARMPSGKRPHLRHLIEEAQPGLIRGLLHQVGGRTQSARVEKNVHRLADELGVDHERKSRWTILG